jgi:hypothetical protein
MDHRNHGDTLSPAKVDRPDRERVCRHCESVVRLVRTIMDSPTGRSVRMFECAECGLRTWDD